MELIRLLKESHRSKRSARNMLRLYGISDDAGFTQPLAEMRLGKAIRLVLNWLTLMQRTDMKLNYVYLYHRSKRFM